MKDTTRDLLRSLKMTAGSRFNAGKRMEKHDRRLTFLTAMTSAYVIALTVLPYFIKLPVPVTDHLNLFTVVLSVVILISSLLQYSSNNTVKAEQYHRSALEINELRRELKIKAEAISDKDFLVFSVKYSSVLQKYSVNHDDIDYDLYKLERPEEFPELTVAGKIPLYARIFFYNNTPNAVLFGLTLLVLWLVFYYAIPQATS